MTTKLLVFAFEYIKGCKKAGKLGTAMNYEKTVKSFRAFLMEKSGAKDITFRKLTEELLFEYECWMFSRGVVRNSTSFYMRNLRSIFNKAVESGAVVPGNLFRKVYTGVDSTRKRAADEELVVRLQKMDLSRSVSLALARDLFVFSFCTRGMAFVDLAFLKKCDIHEGFISYIRRKTGQRLMVGVEPCMERIIKHYEKETSGSPYVFPVITSPDPVIAFEQYRIALNYHNRKLKRLAVMLGERLSLSSYTARHTWATTARKHNVPIAVISAGMGHVSERTTQIYLASLDNSVIDHANHGILGRLNKDAFL